jgi:hypothetical protein
MNIALTDEEIRMVGEALDAVWWSDTLDDASRGTTDTARAMRIQRKLQRALEHTETEFE